MRKMLSLLLALMVVTGGLVAWDATPQPAQALAVDGADFDPGFIISDEVFFNSNAMSEAQIQSFLTSTIGPCSNTNCLSVLKLDTATRPADAMCRGTYTGAAQESVARILHKVGQACGINPQVLMATLQKEQSLISGPISRAPSNSRIDRAMGYACPDNTVIPGYCDPAFGGVYNQLYKAAWQFKRYANPSGTSAFFTKFRPGATANVQYNVPVSCGTKPVYIRNQATANLYYYTPYTPNSAALNNLYGTGNGCSAYGNRNFWVYFNNWFGSSIGRVDPLGGIDAAQNGPGTVALGGWALDPDTTDDIDVDLYVDGVKRTTFAANTSRPDVGAHYPRHGNNHGINQTVSLSGGSHELCAYGINSGAGKNALLGCVTVGVTTGAPIGGMDARSDAMGKLTVNGWAIDPDTSSSVKVHVYVDGSARAVTTANASRPDVGRVHRGYGDNHGINVTADVPSGPRTVCAYALDTQGGPSSLLGCSTVVVRDASPFGGMDATAADGRIRVNGWTIDPDTASPIGVHVYVNGKATASTLASAPRSDIGRHYPAAGPNHGISTSFMAPSGTHDVCAYGLNVGTGSNSLLGCQKVTVSASPIGGMDARSASTGTVTVNGWTLDPDTTAPLQVHVYVDGAPATVSTAAASRPDVARVYPAFGAKRGIDATFTAASGSRSVCAYGINVGGGTNSLLGCQTIAVR